jgi:hemerythrin-like domain-containing protein
MSTRGKPRIGSANDVLDMLRADHDRIKALFRDFGATLGRDDEDRRKAELVDDICYELTLHMMVEEEVFYQALRTAIDDEQLLEEADVEHAGARELIAQLEVMFPGDDHFDATVTVLGEEFEHHIEKEETELFEAARNAGIDLEELGLQLAARKEALEEDLTSPPSPFETIERHEDRREQPRPRH